MAYLADKTKEKPVLEAAKAAPKATYPVVFMAKSLANFNINIPKQSFELAPAEEKEIFFENKAQHDDFLAFVSQIAVLMGRDSVVSLDIVEDD